MQRLSSIFNHAHSPCVEANSELDRTTSAINTITLQYTILAERAELSLAHRVGISTAAVGSLSELNGAHGLCWANSCPFLTHC